MQHGMLMRAHAAHRMAAPRDTHVVGRRRVAESLGEASVRQLSGRERETGPPRFFFLPVYPVYPSLPGRL